ncbi:carbohydrate ABC transporter permease [Kitasatospora kifunensis]|uniref:Multiple sugar transport system permease protein/raffinose/stachyose/melibiose transport system permease protein n=1 Tax=Kitasatospora kifunensis TaxID=58351 RepID=A0A7W7VYQ2_KITKI|nr:sugar ABC transporter permease [Kitasatospora kifunensis]MBB4927283.1 multiple sugar transport system permease protein/raffinose/stachyose/melibiose transport system permease protein [Kitasatospora kifunensis]
MTALDSTPPTRIRSRPRRLSPRDRLTLTLMAGVPTVLTVGFVWIPALLSMVLSFSSWPGIGGVSSIHWVGLQNYRTIFTIYPEFTPAVQHNLLWLAVFFCLPAPLGLFLAVQLDKQIRFSRFYQNVLFMPVVLSLALIGFMTELIFSPTQGLINNLTGHAGQHGMIDWLGDPKLNIWAVLVMACWRQTGYIMIMYLAGLKSVDPAMKEAAALDGANQWQTFRHVVWPALRSINVVVLVITVVESLRAFDIVYVINHGTNGLQLLSVLVTDNIIGEASRIGFGSALATILLLISMAFIVPYLITVFRKDQRG